LCESSPITNISSPIVEVLLFGNGRSLGEAHPCVEQQTPVKRSTFTLLSSDNTGLGTGGEALT